MTNPARELHSIFVRWSDRGSAAAIRNLNQQEAWDTPIRAVQLVAAIDRELALMDSRGQKVDTFREARVAWLRMIFAYPDGWQGNNGSSNLAAQSRMDVLDTLAVVFEVAVTEVPATQADALDQCLSDVLGLLKDDDSLQGPLREILFDLVSEAQRALNDFRTTGRFERLDVVRRLWVALWAAEAQSSKKGGWSDLAQRVWAPAAAGFLGGLPGTVVQAISAISG